MTTDTQLEPYAGEFAIFGPEAEEFLDILEENTGSRQVNTASIPVWRYPSAEGVEWIYEDETGARHRTPDLTGVVLAQRKERVFYRDKFSGGGSPPDCRSNDGETGVPFTDRETGEVSDLLYTSDGAEVRFGGACASCPLAQWESRRLVDPTYTGNGQACAEYRFGIIQRPEQPTPEGFRIPPSALKNWLTFGEQVSRARTRLSSVVIRMSLSLRPKASTADLVVEPVAYIPLETAAQLRALAPDIKRPQIAAPVEEPEDDGSLPF